MTGEAQARLYTEYYDKLLHYFYSKVNQRSLAEDLCADALVKVYEKIDTFDSDKASLATWVFTVARNTLTDYYRTRRVHEELPEQLPSDSGIDDVLMQEEELDTLADALEALESRQRDIILLHYYSGLTLKEVAVRMGMSYSNVKLLHNKALAEMQRYFLEHS